MNNCLLDHTKFRILWHLLDHIHNYAWIFKYIYINNINTLNSPGILNHTTVIYFKENQLYFKSEDLSYRTSKTYMVYMLNMVCCIKSYLQAFSIRARFYTTNHIKHVEDEVVELVVVVVFSSSSLRST